MRAVLIVIALSVGCRKETSEGASPCADRAGDGDCDGVPDNLDLCPGTSGAHTDASGCSDAQAADCTVELVGATAPDLATGERTFTWRGTCETYLLQFSPDGDFLLGRTKTALRTPGTQAVLTPAGPFWRVQGGMTGSSRPATSASMVIP